MYYEVLEEEYIQEQEYIQAEREAQELFEEDMRAEGEIMDQEERLGL